ncbi:hypothetical protein [Halodesulfovibrio spirochaetisodalis]|uniref:Uncharacterized protein n=1 Tax=Halodesulfovibrio spirochaetisodalis TaxID=1560234 RepID=A0A1B7XH26_9BACT|nr:hypothetical protein [Halodesulfovibrio spirochaetisodalis]OBQ54822.1 hypothetical protein SP90_04880 [Halodesulfovibrio spirochaetisodalis]
MSDNTKNGIIDLTEIVEMGTPPAETEKTIPASSAGTVDFDSELEDLFNTTDFSEFADDSTPNQEQAEEPVIDLVADTPTSEPTVEDLLTDFAPEVDVAVPSNDTTPSDSSYQSDIESMLDAAEGQGTSDGFDVDFEDLLEDFSEPSGAVQESVHQPDFDEDLSAMSAGAADEQPSFEEEAVSESQAVASEPVHTASNGDGVSDSDVDDMFADFDFDVDEGSAAVASAESSAAPADEDDLLAGFDFDSLESEEETQAVQVPDPAPASSTAPSDEDLFADLGLEFDVEDTESTPLQGGEPEVAPSAAEPVEPPSSTEPVSAVASGAFDFDEDSDVDDLFADIDLEAELAKPEPEPKPKSAPKPKQGASNESFSLDDPFDVEDILQETSDDLPPDAEQDDSGLSDLDDLLRGDDMSPRTDFTPADGVTLESEEVDMDDIGSLLLDFDETVEPVRSTSPSQPAQQVADDAFEQDAPVEVVEEQPAAPVDPSVFDADIDALLDDLEMASAEPAASVEEQVAPAAVMDEVEEVIPASAPEVPDDEIDLDALLESDSFADAEPVAANEREVLLAPPAPASVEPNVIDDASIDEGSVELESMLNEPAFDIEEVSAAVEDIEIAPSDELASSPAGATDEFETILDELDSLLDDQDAVITAADEAGSVSSDKSPDSLLEVPVDDVLDDSFELPHDVQEESAAVAVDSVPESDPLGDPTSLEEDLDSTLGRILGEEPLGSEAVEPVEAVSDVEPADFSHTDIDEILSEAVEDPTDVTESAFDGEVDIDAALSEALASDDVPLNELSGEYSEQDDLGPADEPDLFGDIDSAGVDNVGGEIDGNPAFDESVLDVATEALAADEALSESAELAENVDETLGVESVEDADEIAEFAAEAALQVETPVESALDTDADEQLELAEISDAESEDASSEFTSVTEVMDAIDELAPVEDIAQEAMADLEMFAEEEPEVLPEDTLEEVGQQAGSGFDMEEIDANAAPVPHDASLEDLMRESTVVPPEFTDSSMELLDTTPEVNSGEGADSVFEEAPAPVVTAGELAEMTERISYLENTLQRVLEMQEAQAQTPPPAPVVEKEFLVDAIDEAFDMDGPLMARVLSAVEVRTETLIESLGTRIEGQMRGAIEQTAARSAAEVIREELRALLAEDSAE